MGENKLTVSAVMEALSQVIDPELGKDLVSLNMAKSEWVKIDNSTVEVQIELTTAGCPLKDKIQNDCRESISKMTGFSEIKINFTSKLAPSREIKLPSVRKVIAISSGKGGVGKSTVAVNIARAFSKAGFKVGLLDADIYGPNIPTLIGNYTKPQISNDEKLMPVIQDDIKFISMGLLLEPGQPVIWRGPMLHGVVKQFLADVSWGELDYLFVDLPPGTGDVHLSLCQLIDLSGAIIVTTPQQLSIVDVKKGIGMFRQLQVNILGIVENMSFYINPANGDKIYVFGKEGGVHLSREWNLPLLAQIPIDPAICEKSYSGVKYLEPVVDKINSAVLV